MARQLDCGPSSPTDSPPPQPSFFDLPPEIREQIWLETLSPRKIMLHWYIDSRNKGHDPPTYRNGRSVARRRTTSIITFNATIIDSTDRPKFFSSHYEWNAAYSSTTAPPPGPVALQVCRESRTIALLRYELCFGRACLEQTQKGPHVQRLQNTDVNEPRIWIDFERDEIVVDSKTCRIPSDTSVCVLKRFALEESTKIRWLSLGGRWEAADARERRLCMGLSECLKSFEMMKEVVIYDHNSASLSRTPRAREQWNEQARKEILEELERAKMEQPDWTAELPLVKVICDF